MRTGTFNTIEQGEWQMGGNFPVWVREAKVKHFGAVIDHTKFAPGTVIGAGTPLIDHGPGQTADIIRAEAYSETGKYAVGALVVQDEKIYKNKTAITAGEAFTSAKWDDITGQITGFVKDDVRITEHTTHATCAIAYDGKMYADRVQGAIVPRGVEQYFRNAIEFIRES